MAQTDNVRRALWLYLNDRGHQLELSHVSGFMYIPRAKRNVIISVTGDRVHLWNRTFDLASPSCFEDVSKLLDSIR